MEFYDSIPDIIEFTDLRGITKQIRMRLRINDAM